MTRGEKAKLRKKKEYFESKKLGTDKMMNVTTRPMNDYNPKKRSKGSFESNSR